MASPAAVVSALSSPRLLQPSPVASAPPLPTRALPFPRRRLRRSVTTAAYAAEKSAAVQKQSAGWTAAPVSAIGPATEDKSIFLVTLDLSAAPDLVDSYTTPGQYLLTRVPEKQLKPAYIEISSAPRKGLQFELLVKSEPGTTAEQLCKLSVGDVVELGPVGGRGFAVQNINPPKAAETVVLFAAGVGISPIRALIEFGFAANERADVRLYYGSKDLRAMPFQEEFKKWEQTGVNVIPVIGEPVQDPFLRDIDNIIVKPYSTGAVQVGSREMKADVAGALLNKGVPHDKILTIEWSPSE